MKKQWMMGGVCFLLFLITLALVLTVDVAAIGPEGTSVGLSRLNGDFHELIGGFRQPLYSLTQKLGYMALAVAAGVACLGVVQMIQRRGLTGMDRRLWLLAGLYAVTAVLYVLFEKVVINYRPVLMEGETAPEASFPSSHTLLACVIWGSAFLLIPRLVRRSDGLRILLRGLCVLFGAATVVGRLLSGVHWLTDILAGLFLGFTLLFLFAGCLARVGASSRNARQAGTSARDAGPVGVSSRNAGEVGASARDARPVNASTPAQEPVSAYKPRHEKKS